MSRRAWSLIRATSRRFSRNTTPVACCSSCTSATNLVFWRCSCIATTSSLRLLEVGEEEDDDDDEEEEDGLSLPLLLILILLLLEVMLLLLLLCSNAGCDGW